MKVLACSLVLFLAIYYLPGLAKANLDIVEPFPHNIYPIESESASVTCVAFDSQDATARPQEIKFMRKNRLAMYTELTPDGNIYFTSTTENNGRKLYVTMHIMNVTSEHDSLHGSLGRYECHAIAVGDPTVTARHGFSVDIITQSEFPHLSVRPSGNHILQRGDNITLTCSLTGPNYNHFVTTLKRISWQKDGSKVPNTCSVRYPGPSNPADFLDPLVLNNIDVGDAGTYKCFLEILLRNIKRYNVLAETTITVQ